MLGIEGGACTLSMPDEAMQYLASSGNGIIYLKISKFIDTVSFTKFKNKNNGVIVPLFPLPINYSLKNSSPVILSCNLQGLCRPFLKIQFISGSRNLKLQRSDNSLGSISLEGNPVDPRMSKSKKEVKF